MSIKPQGFIERNSPWKMNLTVKECLFAIAGRGRPIASPQESRPKHLDPRKHWHFSLEKGQEARFKMFLIHDTNWRRPTLVFILKNLKVRGLVLLRCSRTFCFIFKVKCKAALLDYNMCMQLAECYIEVKSRNCIRVQGPRNSTLVY